MPIKMIKEFLKLEASSGILLIAATVLALAAANTPLAALYQSLLDTPLEFRVGAFELAKPILLWINDGLMAVFFLLIGLEVKREIMQGELSSAPQVILPGIAAVGGMAIPALVYAGFNMGNAVAMNGWAIPAATDIAFALGVLALLGDRVPASLKIFLLALAIIDDLGAIVIIAVFYSGDLSMLSLLMALVCLTGLIVLNWRGVTAIGAYIVIGVLLWVFVLKSGVHATLAGVAVGFAIPLKGKEDRSPLQHLEHALHPWVAYAILPVFAFANAGVPLAGLSVADILQPVPLGILLGLVVGKLVGVFGFSIAVIKMGLARLPDGATLSQLLGVSLLCGIGFTMSLFIGSLAFEHTGGEYLMTYRLGILGGSLIAALLGYFLLRMTAVNAK